LKTKEAKTAELTQARDQAAAGMQKATESEAQIRRELDELRKSKAAGADQELQSLRQKLATAQKEKEELEQQLNTKKATWEERAQEAKSVHDNLKTKMETLRNEHESKVAQMREETKTARKNLAASNTKSQEEQTDLKARLKKSHDEALAAEKQAFNEEKGTLEQQLEEAKTKLAQCQKEKAAEESKKVLQLRKQLKSAETAKKQLVSEMNELKEQHVSEKKEMERVVAEAREKLANDRSRNTKEKADIEQKLSQKSKKILEECKSKFEKKMEALQTQLRTAKGAETECQQSLAELNRTLEQQQKELKTKERLLNDRKTQLDVTEKKLMEGIEGNAKTKAELEACQKQSQENESEMKSIKEAHNQMKKSMTEIQKKLEEKEKKCKQVSLELEEKKAKLVSQIKDNNKTQAKLKTCIQREKELREAQETLEEEKADCAANLKKCEDTNDQVQAAINEAQQMGLLKMLNDNDKGAGSAAGPPDNSDSKAQEKTAREAQAELSNEDAGQAAGSPDGSDPEAQEGSSDDGDEGEDVDSVISDAGLAAGPAADGSDSNAQEEPSDEKRLLRLGSESARTDVLNRFEEKMAEYLGTATKIHKDKKTRVQDYTRLARQYCSKYNPKEASKLAGLESVQDDIETGDARFMSWTPDANNGILLVFGFDDSEPSTWPFHVHVMCKLRSVSRVRGGRRSRKGSSKPDFIKTAIEIEEAKENAQYRLRILRLIERTLQETVAEWCTENDKDIKNLFIEVSISPLTKKNVKYYHNSGYKMDFDDKTSNYKVVEDETGSFRKLQYRERTQDEWGKARAKNLKDPAEGMQGVYMRRMIPLSVE